jgi:shikimate kinase
MTRGNKDQPSEKDVGRQSSFREPIAVSPGRSLIFLIGYRGTGKTAVARILAEELKWGWADSDQLVESRASLSIRQIFEQEGEAGFRDREAAVLDELCRRQKQVIATGGGVVLREDNRRKLRSAGRVVWLTAEAATLWRRMQEDPTTANRRPPLTVGGLQEVEQVLKAREALYRACADLTVSTEERSLEEVSKDIFSQLLV